MSDGYDWQLHHKLLRMREGDPTLHLFYCCAPWRHLRAKVLEEHHGECYDCAHAEPARYVPAECVHHVHEVDTEPGWALSEWVPNGQGEMELNLLPLCHECHDKRHDRFKGRQRRDDSAIALTPERW